MLLAAAGRLSPARSRISWAWDTPTLGAELGPEGLAAQHDGVVKALFPELVEHSGGKDGCKVRIATGEWCCEAV